MKLNKTKILFTTGIFGILSAETYSQTQSIYMCKACPAGTYAGLGSNTCTQCPAGSYSQIGASSCTKCGTDEYSVAGATSCSKCPAGKTSDSTGSKCVDIKLEYKIEATIAEFTSGGKESSGILQPGFYAVILGGGNGGSFNGPAAFKYRDKHDPFSVDYQDSRTPQIGGAGARLQYVFQVSQPNTKYQLISGEDGTKRTKHDGDAAGGGGASLLDIDGKTIYIAGGGGGRSNMVDCDLTQGGFGGSFGAGGAGGGWYNEALGYKGGNSGNLKGGAQTGDGENGKSGEVLSRYNTLFGANCYDGGSCSGRAPGGRGENGGAVSKLTGSSDPFVMMKEGAKLVPFFTHADTKEYYGGVGGFCSTVKDLYQTDPKCIFQGGGCSEKKDGEISKAYGTGDELRAKFNELSEICETPLQEYIIYNEENSVNTVYLRHPGNGKTNVKSNTDKFNDKLCSHCAKLYKIK